MIVTERIRNCFANAPVNTARQKELDIAKGIAIVFMVFSHAYEILAWFFDPEVSQSISGGIFDMLLGGAFAAPVFMFCMGISFQYSRKTTAADMLMRGVRMLGIAFLLEVFRTAIPGTLEWLIFREPGCLEGYAYLFFCVDILQFVALAMLMMALFIKLKLKAWMMVAVAAAFSVAGQLLQLVSTGSYIGDMAAGFIWHSYEESYFPLLNWLIFPVCGYAFGAFWQRLKDKDAFFRIVTPVCWGITALYFLSMAVVGEWYFLSGGDFYGIGLPDAVFAMAVALAVIGFGYYLNKWAGGFAAWLASMGERVNSVYCIHWTIYGFMYLAILCAAEDYLPQWSVMPAAILVIIASDMISRIYRKLRKR